MLVKISSWGNDGDGIYIVVGRLIKDAELAFVGGKGTPRTKLTLNVGNDMDLVNVTLWRYMAKRFSSLKKWQTVFGLCIRKTNEHNGEKYANYTAEYIGTMGENASVQDIPTTKQEESTKQEEFVEISLEDMPFI